MEDSIKKNIPYGNVITIFSLWCAFISILLSMSGKFTEASLLIIVSSVLDVFDGKVARMTNTASKFGAELDSLADMVAFGIAPSILMFCWVIQPHITGVFMPLGWGACFVFISCVALRLARFNVDTSNQASAFFVGLPSPAGALSVIGFYGFFEHYYHINHFVAFLAVFWLFLLGISMVSSIPFFSVKKLKLTNKLLVGLIATLVMGVILVYPWIFLFFGMILYISSGFLILLFRKRNSKKGDL